MRKGRKILHHSAFTLIEVMISVVIISTVIMALLEMYANNTHIFSKINQRTQINQYSTLFIANDDFGLEKKKTNLYELVKDFDLEDDLRRELKNTKVQIIYQELDKIDMGQFDEKENEDMISDEEKEVNSDMMFEIGKTILKTDKSSVGYLRLRVQ